MKKFTKLLIGCSLVASQLANAQAPLLPLFENNTIKWGANSSMMDISTGNGYDFTNRYELYGDTIINSELYKILFSNSKTCSQRNTTEPFCRYYHLKKYVLQRDNLIIEVDKSGKLIDTVLFMQSTIVNSKVRFLQNNYTIVSLDSIDFNNTKIRRFKFENSYAYLDGIGFDNNGPFPTTLTYAIFEGSAYLNCYEKDEASYSMVRSNGMGEISGINLSTTACQNPLGIEYQNNNNENNFSSIFVNQNNQLETSQIASSIEVFNSKGQKMLQNKDASTTDISSLSNGFYIANITYANKQVRHKFLVNN